jgi:hypothetical protein
MHHSVGMLLPFPLNIRLARTDSSLQFLCRMSVTKEKSVLISGLDENKSAEPTGVIVNKLFFIHYWCQSKISLSVF